MRWPRRPGRLTCIASGPNGTSKTGNRGGPGLRAYQGARRTPVLEHDGWLSMDDEDDWDAMLFSRWPVLSNNFVRGPPATGSRETA